MLEGNALSLQSKKSICNIESIFHISLTAEFCQGRDGPVLFGDDENGYVMSYMFKLRDSQARGEARFYSLMMLMTDRVYLISCWPFLVRFVSCVLHKRFFFLSKANSALPTSTVHLDPWH